ncbi:hypothetical protein J2Z60_001371 [Lactobacillus colini]|uniref:Uncharacterized protein n=1 Tax=Lactobacillus colini TaxID=1819254 RepID=A0ABS4MES9_9LACO|nr:hypothetical protein [Lactobacillus colini]MBP2058194.1 hypothetical protein [Lactobacillus colini]
MNNWITLGIGFMLSSTGFLYKKKTGHYDWLYLILGIVIIFIGIGQLLGLVKLT